MGSTQAKYGSTKEKIDSALLKSLSGLEGRSRFIRDTECPGFFVRVSVAGRVSFGVAYSFDGRERRMSLGTFPEVSVLAARKAARTRRAEAMLERDPLEARRKARANAKEYAEAPTLADLKELYFSTHIYGRRPNGDLNRTPDGAKNEERYWRSILDSLGAKLKVRDLCTAKIVEMHRLISEGTPANANRVHASLGCALGHAIRAGWIDRNPATGIKRNPENPRERYLSDKEVARLKDAIDEHSDRVSALVIWLALLTGARRGELLKAKWADIDMAKGVWVKPRATTKQRRTHRLPLSQDAIAALREIKKLAPSTVQVLPGNPESVLTRLKRAWRVTRRTAGLEDVRFHDLRHAHASILISRGFSLAVVGAALGHTQAQTTLRYAHLMDDTLREATQAVAAFAAGAKCN